MLDTGSRNKDLNVLRFQNNICKIGRTRSSITLCLGLQGQLESAPYGSTVTTKSLIVIHSCKNAADKVDRC
jgi:hypothetical protein